MQNEYNKNHSERESDIESNSKTQESEREWKKINLPKENQTLQPASTRSFQQQLY